MVDVRPFRGLRYSPDAVTEPALVLAPPYDVISEAEHRALLNQSPLNVVRLELPTSETGDKYDQAAATLGHWRTHGVLTRDERPAFYLYETRFHLNGEERARRTLVAGVRLTPWDAGQVLPHERTMAGPKEDRLRLLRATRANLSPIWMLYQQPSPSLTRAWDRALNQEPALVAQLDDGIGHRLWKLDDPDLLAAIQADFAEQRLFIADGHHRYETALRYRDELEAAGQLEANRAAELVMAHLVDQDDAGMVILPTHRLVRQLGPLDQADLEADLGADWHYEYFPIWDGAPPEQLKALLEQLAAHGEREQAVALVGPDPTIFGILTLRNKQLMEQRAPERSAAWRALDVALLDEGLLKPLLAQTGANREEALVYERDPYAALLAVRQGEAQLALFLNGTKPDQVIAVAEAGDRMPEKSTYFYPKPPTGLVIRDVSGSG
jgi:uncharacterized protein (DUF1015 family)